MKTVYLADAPEFVPTLAQWYYDEWNCFMPGKSVRDVEAAVRGRLNRDRLPLALVVVDGESVIGTASLKPYDMATRMDLSPWLSSVYVAQERRGAGIGSSLVAGIVAEASRLGYRSLHLFTPSAQGFYARLGWTVLQETVYCGLAVTVMRRGLNVCGPAGAADRPGVPPVKRNS